MLAAEPAHQTKVTAPVSNESFVLRLFLLEVRMTSWKDLLQSEISEEGERSFAKLACTLLPNLEYSICH